MPTILGDFVSCVLSVCAAVMRCLGVPCRCVSTFDAAHDTEENLRVDIYLNERGEKLNSLTFDSVWYCQMGLNASYTLGCLAVPHFPAPAIPLRISLLLGVCCPEKRKKAQGFTGLPANTH